ncbi:hypothetical protein F441_10327 [Phytophthora nicotianae CJ01A1]|uniref:Uncharacterized protein n=6 Tax=Phytophthora nicotianae TaxID=4792 RepID=W2R8G9_PHYN3|nr:hypothetical protein PPTG_01824 [Phytophthora nicotianae INRA-310]ETI44930.1 hypothetical protein F443_10375 [Phytophthora nicotianae P1569]ETK84931.1 hypothetical protein L915_10150 [Phytophthora nicotianae]ETO73574.1 hypothetical protein F444_10487 [Phytophthora nicotianae P1976]ETP14757.1 hypothetical protein F441_10327 [Phytophthora nicotianae CJ01A1]ETP42827.1 hypothetical protein F442_10293 [Phytophthora nicotianae P10297]KUF86147.1 hypothetical protein AM587_10009107 [Phytophthora n
MPSAKWEIARIGVYISIPIVATCIYAQPDCINYIINRWKYIQYPPQAVSREEYYKKMREVANEDK